MKPYNLTEYCVQAHRYGIMIVYVPNENAEAKAATGIHLTNPSEYELQDAVMDADNKGFKTIYIHH
jgi:hypothetical protein